MACDPKFRLFVSISIEGMCDPHSLELKQEIEQAADRAVRAFIARNGGEVEQVHIGPGSETTH